MPLIGPSPHGDTLLKAARRLGARVAAQQVKESRTASESAPFRETKDGISAAGGDRWLSGTRAFDDDAIGDSRLALSGVFSGAAAVRQVFACVLAGWNIPERDVTVSRWTPWENVGPAAQGPQRFDVPDKLWLLGLGHLGQAFVWNL